MKWIALTSLILVFALWDSLYIGCYSEGSLGQAWSILNPIFLGLPFFMALFVWFVSSASLLFKRKNRIFGLCLILGFVAMVISHAFLPAPGAMCAYGIRDRMMKAETLDDLRHMASELRADGINALHGKPEYEPGSFTGFESLQSDPDQQAAAKNFQLLKKRYSVLSWGMGELDGPSIFERDNSVEVCWGGGLAGHWGVSIGLGGQKNVPVPGLFKTIQVADDIYFFSEE
jgi:hypothetical protein